ncbi:MAG: sugar phosphate isomerase/epimerase family protein [Candidatus Solibacter sp.]
MNRRNFFTQGWQLAAASALAIPGASHAESKVARLGGVKLKLGLNAYSFDRPLKSGEMTLEDLVVYCAQNGFDALDATGYYFPGYPKVPSDDVIRSLKKKAYLNGIALSSTGVRNDFSLPDTAKRQLEVQRVKDWIVVAAKLGAPVIRVFSGLKIPEGHTFETVLPWMTADFKECAEWGRQHGVILGLQNHNDFLKTADQTIQLVNAVKSEWFGVILDIGSLRSADPYEEIEKLVPYAVSWQLKELVGIGGKEIPTDLRKVKAVIDKVGYRGYLPIETLGAGDPKEKVGKFFAQVRSVFAN